MPASQVMKKFKEGKLRSGSKSGPKVTNPAQAKAIQISEARDEGHHIPKPKRGNHEPRAGGRHARNKRLAKAKI